MKMKQWCNIFRPKVYLYIYIFGYFFFHLVRCILKTTSYHPPLKEISCSLINIVSEGLCETRQQEL